MKNVLVVDDNAIVRRHLRGLLERDGCLVCEAADGQRALELLDARSFDVMFLDLHMPAMDGSEVLKALAERKKHLPVVLITSSDSSAEIVRAFKMGARDYLTKPFREPLLRRTLEKVTGLDFNTIQRTRADVALLDTDDGLAQVLAAIVTDGSMHHVEDAAAVPECLRRLHQLVLVGHLDAADADSDAEALADLALQTDPGALLVRLLPPGRTLPEVTVFHASVPRDDEGAMKRLWRAVRSGGVMAAGRQIRALRYEGPPELEHAYWWTLQHSLETAFRSVVGRGSNVTLDLSLAPDSEAQLTPVVDWAMEYAERNMVELALVRDPPPSSAKATNATLVQERSALAQLKQSSRTEVGLADGERTPGQSAPSPLPTGPSSTDSRETSVIEVPGFTVGPLIGEGGMSRVYRATQRSLKRDVCIKVMRTSVAADPGLTERFRDEGAALAALRHPNIVSVLDVGRSADGQLYMVMEYVNGCDLRGVAGRGRRLAVPRAIELAAQLLSGLAEAHGHGIIHRDLKPSNVLVTELKDGTRLVKLVDFGIAKVLEGAERRSGVTRAGMVVGTPGYMAPEQLLGMDVTAATDLYAVGVILFEILAGERPHVARDEFELAQATMLAPVPRLREIVGAEIPEALDELVARLLTKNPKDRPQSANEVRAALLAVPVSAAA